jgi:AcrR family transcriptional regulator
MSDRELRKKQITEQREDQILKAALEIFTRKGYTAATIPEIAEMAGVAVGTIYNYYSDKRELFIAVMKNLVLTDPVLDINDNIQGADITDIIEQIMQNRIRLTETEPGSRIPYLMSEIVRDPELKDLWVEHSIQPLFIQMEAVFRSTMASGRLRHVEPAVAVRAVTGMVIGLNMLMFLEGDKSPLIQLSREKLAHALADFILHGLAAVTGDKNI